MATITRRVALETLPALGIVDLGGSAEEIAAGEPTVRLTPRGRALLAGVKPTIDPTPSKFIDSQALRVGQSARIAHVLALSPFAELGRVGAELDSAPHGAGDRPRPLRRPRQRRAARAHRAGRAAPRHHLALAHPGQRGDWPRLDGGRGRALSVWGRLLALIWSPRFHVYDQFNAHAYNWKLTVGGGGSRRSGWCAGRRAAAMV
ncbi:MAG: hypothetical protein V9G14_17680 [Cypionkella sp.]